jgi:hypothetical protein
MRTPYLAGLATVTHWICRQHRTQQQQQSWVAAADSAQQVLLHLLLLMLLGLRVMLELYTPFTWTWQT